MVREISIDGLSKSYSKRIKALSELSIKLRKGETLILLGQNGAGKTTFIKILAGILPFDSGEIRLDGKKFLLGDFPSHRFGAALQEIGLWPHLTVTETLEFVGKLYRMPPKILKENLNRLIDEFGLQKAASNRISNLSDGMKRRVNLVCALIHDPPVLLLDEPSLGLDVESRFQLWTHLKKIKDKILLISTHDMEEAEKLGERIAILYEGKIIAESTPAELKKDQASISDAFLSLTHSNRS